MKSAVALPDDPAAIVAAADDPGQAILVLVDRARAWLVEATHVEDVVDVKAKAAAIQAYAVQARLGREAEMAACEIRFRAERRQGELLTAMPKAKPGPKSVGATDRTPTLDDLGISKTESEETQKLASIPDREFEEAVTELKSTGKLSRTALLKRRRDAENEANRQAIRDAGFSDDIDPAKQAEVDARNAAMGALSSRCIDINVDIVAKYDPADFANRFGSDAVWPRVMPRVIAARDWLTALTKEMGY